MKKDEKKNPHKINKASGSKKEYEDKALGLCSLHLKNGGDKRIKIIDTPSEDIDYHYGIYIPAEREDGSLHPLVPDRNTGKLYEVCFTFQDVHRRFLYRLHGLYPLLQL